MVQEKLLTVNKLRTEFFQNKKTSVTAINEISFDIGKGEILGLVGESGCGKSVTSLSIMRLLNFTSGKVTKGEVIFDGKDLQKLSEKEMQRNPRRQDEHDLPGANEQLESSNAN